MTPALRPSRAPEGTRGGGEHNAATPLGPTGTLLARGAGLEGAAFTCRPKTKNRLVGLYGLGGERMEKATNNGCMEYTMLKQGKVFMFTINNYVEADLQVCESLYKDSRVQYYA